MRLPPRHRVGSISILRHSRRYYDCWPLKGACSQSVKIKTGKTLMFSLSQKFLFSSFLRKQESSFFWIPGRVSLARNDNPTFPKMSNARSPPAEPGVYLTAIKTLESDSSKSFDRFIQSLLINSKGHPDEAFSILSKTISWSSDDPSLLEQDCGEFGGCIPFWNLNP